jgi:hypothetical protein
MVGGYEVQFWGVGKDCVDQDGRDSPVGLEPCNPNTTGDVWLIQGPSF